MRSVADVAAATSRAGLQLAAPEYRARHQNPTLTNIGFGVASMKHHMTDEGWQLFEAFRAGGYSIFGEGYYHDSGHIPEALLRYRPDTVVLQDKREWTGRTAGPGFDEHERFHNVESLRGRSDIFKLTVLKDAHADQAFHEQAAEEIGCHAWVVYYHPRIVAAQAPYVRPEHLVRTYHSVDPRVVPPFDQARVPLGLLSGAVSGAYPLRSRLALACRNNGLKHISHLQHPGYGRNGCWTPNYLKMLSNYRVAVCTSSRFGYAVRKIVEATAAGCVVVTDLPKDDVLPEIDGNRLRIDSDTAPGRVDELVGQLAAAWDADVQRVWAERAKKYYDYRALGVKLAADIEALRRKYNG